jgi:hypothetical protein
LCSGVSNILLRGGAGGEGHFEYIARQRNGTKYKYNSNKWKTILQFTINYFHCYYYYYYNKMI